MIRIRPGRIRGLILVLASSHAPVSAAELVDSSARPTPDAYAVTGSGRTRVAHNPSQDWSAHFDGRGFLVEPAGRAWTWGLELVGYAAGECDGRLTDPFTVRAQGARVTYEWDASLSEWWINDERGLEHGYTLLRRASEQDDPLVLTLAVRGGLTPRVRPDGRGVDFVDPGGTPRLGYTGLMSFDATGRQLQCRFERAGDALRLSVDDSGAVYPLTIDPVAHQTYLKASNTGTNDDFGWSVALSGDTLAVGALGEASAATGVGGDQGDNSADSAGAVYVFVRSGASWLQQAYLKASNTGAADTFGHSLAISGDTLVVGAPEEDSAGLGVGADQGDDSAPSAGAAYVFVRSGGVWSQQAYLKPTNTQALDRFGSAVAISGDTIVVGAPGEDSAAAGVDGNQISNGAPDSGAAYVFARSAGVWIQQAYLKATNTGSGDAFGWSVAVAGDTVLVGAYLEDSASIGIAPLGDSDNSAPDAGAAFVYVRSGTSWSPQARFKASNTGSNDWFGHSVALSGDTAIVGALGEDSSATGVDGNQASNGTFESGAAYVFVRSGANWSQQAYLKASNPGQSDQFGYSVAVHGEVALVGAFAEDSNAIGVDGNQANDSAVISGAAYSFTRSGVAWSPQAYLKASNTDPADGFGSAVAAGPDQFVVGAPYEDSGATGIDGNAADNSAAFAGAAYVFAHATSSVAYCFGNGAGAVCPCGNAGAAGNGCANSVSPGGANLSASGMPSLSADSLQLTGSGMPNSSALYFQGTTASAGGLGTLFGDGLRCASGTVVRLGTKTNAGGASVYPGAGDPSVSVRGTISVPGTRSYQVWYRNAAAFCTPSTFNLTNGVLVAWSS